MDVDHGIHITSHALLMMGNICEYYRVADQSSLFIPFRYRAAYWNTDIEIYSLRPGYTKITSLSMRQIIALILESLLWYLLVTSLLTGTINSTALLASALT